MPRAEILAGIYSESAEFTAAIWLEHAPRYAIAVRDVLERDAINPHDPNGTPRDNWSRGSSGRTPTPAAAAWSCLPGSPPATPAPAEDLRDRGPWRERLLAVLRRPARRRERTR